MLAVAFLFAEHYAAEPVIPLKLFRERVFNAASSIGFVMGFAMFGALTFLPLYMQIVKGVSPTASGLRILPLMLGMLGASVTSGRLVTRWGRYKVFPIVGTALMTIGAYLLSMIDATTNGWVLAGYMFVFGVGMGLVMQVLVVAVQNAVSYEDLGVATSSSVFFRMIGGSFGTAVFGAIYAIVLNHTIAPTLAKVPASVLRNFNPQTINPGVLAQAEVDRRGAVLLHEVHRRGDPCDPGRLPGRGAHRVRGVPLELAPPGGGVAQDRPDGRHRRGERLARPPVVAAGDRAGADPVVGPGEPGRALPDAGPAGGHRSPAPRLLAALPAGRSAGLHGQRRGEAAEGGRRPDSARGRRVARRPAWSRSAGGVPSAISTSRLRARRALDKLTEARRAGLTELLEGWNPEEHPEIIAMVKDLAHSLLADDERLVADAMPHVARRGVRRRGGWRCRGRRLRDCGW